VQAAAHALKGAVSNFAASAASEAAHRMQQIGEAGDFTGARSACALLEAELERVRAALLALVPKTPRRRASRGPRKRARRKPRA
jgi:HPt (histidine-containing phosphotransfer) domain-containing protein